MRTRDYSQLRLDLAKEYERHSPESARIHAQAIKHLVDGGSHALRLIEPFPPRIVGAQGAWLLDEDGHRILDFWQGHFTNILGHNPEIVTKQLAKAFGGRYGLQSGFTDRLQVETAEILCRQTGAERVRFTTSGTLATLNAIVLSRAHTGRDLVLKVGGGWHGGHPWGLKGIGWHDGFEQVESAGIPQSVTDETIVTGFNDPELLEDHFAKFGDRLACFIVEPVIGVGGLMPATREYLRAARALTQRYGALLILDEVISGFRFRAGDAAALYGVQPDLMTLGKAIGGGMPVAAVAGRADVMALVGQEKGAQVKFSGGTYSGHPTAMLAAKSYLNYLVENEAEIYSTLAEVGAGARQTVIDAFAGEGILARFAGDRNEALPGSSLHMLLFPYEDGYALDRPEEVRNPAICDIELSEHILQLALLVEDVFVMHGLGCTTIAHTEVEIQTLGEACQRVARRIKPYL